MFGKFDFQFPKLKFNSPVSYNSNITFITEVESRVWTAIDVKMQP